MAKSKLKILAIDPGTRYMGYAFLDKRKLLYYGVKPIKKRDVARVIAEKYPELKVYLT